MLRLFCGGRDTGDRKGRPYEHELKMVHEVDTFIVHCTLSIVHSQSDTYASFGILDLL